MKQRIIAPLLILPFALQTAFAQQTEPASVEISGFGTGALTRTNTNDAQFVREGQPSGAGKKLRTGVDSNLGLQVDARINDWLSLTGQGIVRKAGEDDYGADATLAFAKFKLSDEVSLRTGRVGLAAFMISDYRNVGYANTFVRPPQEVYAQIPFDTIDGIDLTWQKTFSDTTVTAQMSFGRSLGKLAGGDRVTVTSENLVNVLVEHGPVSVRLGRSNGNVTIESGPYAGPQYKSTFTGAGLGLDWKNIVVQSEYTKTRGGIGLETNAWYVMGGYRFGKLMPYFLHADISRDFNQRTDSIGLRWDAFRSAAIKFQIDHVKPVNGGLFVNAVPGFRGPVNVATAAVDFMF